MVHELPVFVNATAGKGDEESAREIGEALERAGLSARVQIVDPDELAAHVQQEVRRGTPVIGVAGGDGTLSAAAAVLLGTQSALAVFPCGTLNHFARRLHIDDIDAAAAALAGGCVREIAVGTVNGRVFINNASCGIYPHMVRHRNKLRVAIGKWPGAVVASAMVLARFPRLNVEIDVKGYRVRRRTAAVWVGIGHGSFRLPEDDVGAKDDATELEIVVPSHGGRASLMVLAIRVLLELYRHGKAYRQRSLDTLHARSFVLDARRPIDIARDGEAGRLDPPAAFAIHERALKVICPLDA